MFKYVGLRVFERALAPVLVRVRVSVWAYACVCALKNFIFII